MPVNNKRSLAQTYGWVQLILGLGLGWFGSNKLAWPPNYYWGIPAQLLAVFLVLRSFPTQFKVLPPWESAKEESLPEKKAKTVPPHAVFLVLVLLLGVGQWFFRQDWIASASLLTLQTLLWIGWLKFRQGLPDSKPVQFVFQEKTILWIILLVESLLTVPHLGTHFTGLCLDEANNLDDAAAFVGGSLRSPFITGWGGTASLPYCIVGPFMMVLGVKVWVARFVSLLAALLATWFFYRWCRFFYGTAASAVATLGLAVSWWYLYYALSVWHNTLLFLSMICAFYFLEKGLREGKRGDFFWAGISAGACVMNYVPGRTVPLMMAGTLLGYLFLRGPAFIKIYWKPLSLTLLAFLLLTGPFLIYAHNTPGEVWGRVQTAWIGQEIKRTGSILFLFQAYFWSLIAMFGYNPSVLFRFADPPFYFLDPCMGGLFVLGLGLCFLYPKKPVTWVLLPGLFWSLSSNALGLQVSPAVLTFVHTNRISIIIPFLFFGAGWGLEWLLRLAQGFTVLQKKGLTKGFLVLVIAGTLIMNVPVMVTNVSNTVGSWGVKGYPQIEGAKILNENYAKDHFLVESEFVSIILQFLTAHESQFKMFTGYPSLPISYKVSRDLMILMSNNGVAQTIKPKINRMYPHAVWEEYKTFWGEIFLTTVTIPRDEIQAQQNGMTLSEALP